ncbi:Ig-like domain-containing protein [Pontibacter cellulosilyticus]|uniref:Gliding motility-associated C-terminal domain-containing protein n=1 Tax=Pontibacter cellulosilyticus TaxID=1720253 RepID=A0A923NBN6_9BACT|nr:gliding motility-associated C-terminal domain-containing protein [Pontibacter cellulosilyticus]MBC5993980.1 gliding motility-associated C-terminal domain-containing protein [Pontibacter cellulosilyticus]
MHLLLKQLYTTFLLLCLILLTSTFVSAQGGNPLCTATITVDGRTVLCRGETTILRANTGTNLTYEWLLNGNVLPGQISSSIEVSEAGRYQVRVTGSDCQTNTSSEREITVNELPANPNFLVSPTGQQCAGTELTFSVNNPLPDVSYTWIFGDGSTDRGPEVKHTYESKGVGTIDFITKVVATNQAGCESDTVRQTITVRKEPEVAFAEKNSFQTCLPDTIADEDIEVFAEITNETIAPYLGDIRTYFVDWGNGDQQQYSPGAFPISNPTAYDTVGVYPISIRAVAGNGCEVIFTQNYAVSKEPKANFSANDKKRVDENQQPPCVPVLIAPADSSTGGGLSYKWAIQPEQGFELESGTLESKDPVFKFTKSGVYNIELVVTNGCGSDTTSQSVVVGWPQVQLPASVTECGPTTIDYSSSGAGGGGGFPGGGGSGGLFIDKNLGEQVTVTITITGPTSVTRTFNSDTFDFQYDFTTPGKYTVAVEAVNECGSSDDIYSSQGGQSAPVQEVVILQQPAAPSIQAPKTACAGDIVTLTPTSPGPIYVWFESNDPNATPIFTGPSFSTPTLTADVTFYVAAVDTANSVVCIGPKTAVPLTVVPAVTNNTIIGDPVRNTCKGETPAALTGSAPTGGDTSTPYSFIWQISTTNANTGFTNAPGINNTPNYTPTQPINTTTWFRRLVISGSCSADTSNVVEIVAVDPVPATANSINGPQQICEGETPAPLIGTRPTGGGGAPYTFLWEVSTQSATTGFAAAPGTNNGENYTPGALTQDTWFRRKVTSGGCTATSEAVKITVLPELANNTISADQEVCRGTAPAPLTGTAPTGGSGSYTYLWQSSITGATAGFAPAAGNNTNQSYTPGPVTRTTWFRRVVTSAGCSGDTSAVVRVTINPGVTNNSIAADQTVCAGTQPQQLTGSAPTGGTGAFTFLWQSSTISATAGFVNAGGTNNGQNYAPPAISQNTWFRRLVTSAGCTDTSDVVSITIIPVPAAPKLTVQNAKACVGESATLTVENPNGETYEWYDVATGGSPIFIGPVFQTPTLTQSVMYFVQAVSASGCTSTTRTTATVTVVTPQANAGEDVTIIQGRTVELRASGGDTYVWEPAEGLSDPNVPNPVASPDKTTTYTVTVTTAEGCVDTDEVTVEVIPAITVPNAFTPNRDGVNEIWEIENIQNYPEARVEVFNRWGNLIFTSNGYGTPWDGTYKGEDLPVATYYYMIYLNKSEKPISGHVTIIR